MVDPRYGGLMRSDFATQDSTITLTLTHAVLQTDRPV